MAKLTRNNDTETVELSELSDADIETLFMPFHNLGEPEAYAQTRDALGECAPREFMARYLELAAEDLLIG